MEYLEKRAKKKKWIAERWLTIIIRSVLSTVLPSVPLCHQCKDESFTFHAFFKVQICIATIKLGKIFCVWYQITDIKSLIIVIIITSSQQYQQYSTVKFSRVNNDFELVPVTSIFLWKSRLLEPFWWKYLEEVFI